MWPALRHPWFPFLLHRTSQIPIPKTHAFITSTSTIVPLRPDKIKVTIVHPYFVGQVKWFPDISARTCLNMKTTARIWPMYKERKCHKPLFQFKSFYTLSISLLSYYLDPQSSICYCSFLRRQFQRERGAPDCNLSIATTNTCWRIRWKHITHPFFVIK